LYIHLARSQSWQIEGLNFPGHFLVRMEHQGVREIIDPFYDGQIMDASRMRSLVKTVLGEGAELDHAYYEPLSNRSILLRLQHNLKQRLIENEDYLGALQIVEGIQLVAPDEVKLCFDAGVLCARCGLYGQAKKQLEKFIEGESDMRMKIEAQNLLTSIRESQR
jgi:regulator of sirC expression with transglutaminase-like and TPR domain